MNSTALTEALSHLDGACIPWEKFEGSSVLVTGATGLVGLNVVAALLLKGSKCENPPKVYALVRDARKAEQRFADISSENLVFVEGDVTKPLATDETFDYIVHAAARTDSAGMVNEPVSVIATALDGTRNILEFARNTNPKKVVYVSSMEVYGAHEGEERIDEHTYGVVDPLSVRSSYPESKKMCESLCCAYASQYDVPVCIARLAQTFGPGIPSGDKRVFAYFTRCAKEGRNIELATDGSSTRMYVAAADAAAALLTLLADGVPGEAYNVANEDTYCSIRQMADLVATELADGAIAVTIKNEDTGKYPPTHHLKLNVDKIKALGWKPTLSLGQMFRSILDEV